MTVDSGKTSPAVVEYDAYDATVEGVIDALEPLGFESNVIDATGGEPCCSLDLGDGRCLDVTVKLTMTCECCTLDGTHNHNQCEHVCCPDWDGGGEVTDGK